MNSSICPKCGTQNVPGMAFCSNCGQSLAGSAPQSNASDLPPTMLSYKPSGFTPPQSSFTAAPNFSPPPAKKGGKGLLFGLLGCSGLLLISLVGGLAAGIVLWQRSEVLPSPSPYTLDSNSNINNSNQSLNNSNSNVALNTGGAGETMLAELQKAKQIGAFRQTDARIVNAKDYFPLATDAVQATYTNGSQNVYWTIGKFSSSEDTRSDFDTQVTNVKGSGGTIYTNSSKNGTHSAVYKNNKDYYFVETAASDNGSRIHSSDRAALLSFSTALGTAFSKSSNLNQTPTGLVGIWKGTFSESQTTLMISKHNGETFEGTLVRNDGTVILLTGRINPETRSVSMKETRVLKQPKEGAWTLGENTGTLSENGKSMSGAGTDNVNPAYNWSFTR